VKINVTNRGKYLKSRPDINLTYDRPLRKRKDEILRNGNNCNLVIVNDKKLYVKNTCAFDSLVEILTTSYCNYTEFKNWIDKNSENIFLSCNDAPPNASFPGEHRPEAAARRTSVGQWQRRSAPIFKLLENNRAGTLNY